MAGSRRQFAGSAGFTNVASTFTVQQDLLTRHNVYLDGTFFGTCSGKPPFKARLRAESHRR